MKWSDFIILFFHPTLQDLHKLGKCSACVQYLPAFVYATGQWQRLEDTMRLYEVLFEHITFFCFIKKNYITCIPQSSSSRQTLHKLNAVILFYFTWLWEVHFLVAFSSGLNYTNKPTIIAYFAPGQLERNKITNEFPDIFSMVYFIQKQSGK